MIEPTNDDTTAANVAVSLMLAPIIALGSDDHPFDRVEWGRYRHDCQVVGRALDAVVRRAFVHSVVRAR